MKHSLIQRINYLKNRIFDKRTRKLCRLQCKDKSFTRNRKISFSDVLLLTLNKQGQNTSFEIRDYEINKKGESNVNYTDEAYLKQRRQLNPEVFKELNKGYLKNFYHEKKCVKRYKGYVVWAIDGSKDEIPNTDENRQIFGVVPGGGRRKETKVARALMTGAYDVYNNFFGDVEIDKATAYETNLAKKNIEACLEISRKHKNLFIFDRNYPAMELFEFIGERNSKYLMRLSVNDYVEERKQMSTDDEIVSLKYNRHRLHHFKQKNPGLYEKIKDKKEIKVRIINLRLDTGEIESLITNIFDKKFTLLDFKELYNKRWKVEEAYNSLKNKLKIEKFTGKLPIYIYQDIYAQVLVYNQIQDMLNVANEELKEKNKEKKLKHKYKINENKAIGIYKEKFIKLMLIEDRKEGEKEYNKLIKEMIRYVSVVRHGRPSKPRHFTESNKYRINHGSTF